MMQEYERLEHEFAQWAGYPTTSVVACSSGSAALHLALEALQRKTLKSRIVIPDFTMIACARAASLTGLSIDLVDCDDRLLMKPEDAGSYVQIGVGYVMPVHIYGRACEVRPYHVALVPPVVIEDMSEVHGVKPHFLTDAACWSFYKNKIISGEEGGIVAFYNGENASLARKLRSHGFEDSHDFRHIPRGMNYRLSNVHASLIRRSLAAVGENLEDRRKLEDVYNELIPDGWKMPARDVVWVYDIRIPSMTHEKQREVVRVLNSKGVEARCGFYPISKQLEYRSLGFQCSNAWKLSQEVFYLPVNPLMTPDDVARNVSALLELLA